MAGCLSVAYVCSTITFEKSQGIRIEFVYEGHRIKVSDRSRSENGPKPLFSPCKTSIGNNCPVLLTQKPVTFAQYFGLRVPCMGFSAGMCDRHLCHVTESAPCIRGWSGIDNLVFSFLSKYLS